MHKTKAQEQDALAKERLAELKSKPSLALEEGELDTYLKKRGIAGGRLDS